MSEALVIDSTAEDAANVQVDLFAYPFAVTAIRTPTPPLQPRWATPDDADGDVLVASRYQNREITITLEIVPTETTAAARAATAEAALASLADKVTKVNREDGTLRRTMPSGKVQTFDLLTADSLDPPWDIEWDVGNILRFDLKFTAKPFWRSVEISGTTDSFASNTIADYAVTGTGAAISGGRIIVSSTSAKTWLHNARRFIDGTVTLSFRTGASVTTWTQQIVGKAVDSSNHLCVQMTQAGAIAIVKTVRGTPTTLAPTPGANLSTATSYWLRLVMCSNVLTGELWTTDPTLGGSPARTVTWTLAGADITTYGEGVSGLTGFGMTPGGTDWTYDDYSALWMVQEKTLPVLTMTVPGADGDVPALGRLVLTDAQGADQAWAVWGLQSETYSSASTAALYYEAEALTPMGTAAVDTQTGASGGGSNNAVTERQLTQRWTAILSTRARGGGAHLTHAGTFRIFARVLRPTSNTGMVGVATEWGLGDFRSFTRNDPIYLATTDFQGSYVVVDLGLADIPAGTAQWEARIIATSTVDGDDLSVDFLWLVPVEGYGEAERATSQWAAPSALTANDAFNQTAGNLTGKTLQVGGTWNGAGDADDFTVDTTAKAAKRAVSGDAGSGFVGSRFVFASGTTGMTDQGASVDIRWDNVSTAYISGGLLLRYRDINNWFIIIWQNGFGLNAWKCTAGVQNLAAMSVDPSVGEALTTRGSTLRMSVFVWADGTYQGVIGPASSAAYPFSGSDSDLATGGALAAGAAGFWDNHLSTDPFPITVNRYYDNFACWTQPNDAAVFASQSVQIRYDGALREDASGTLWIPVSRYAGDRLYLPPAGAERQNTRLLMKTSRSVPGGADRAIDDTRAQLYLTPRYL